MNTGNWNIVKEVFNRALELPEDERGPYLQDACGGNEELLKDISGLLDSFDSEFMERPAIAEVAEFIVGDEDKLAAGDRLNHYRIVKLLGSGGMGEVYLAEDTKLNRQVAVKLLPPLSITDPEANRRFLLEAQTAAELDHPHICTVHEIGESDGRSYIVMQYIKGETLAERIRRQPLTIKEALDFTSQIADALAEAHARGIVHRDIKPSNVIINPREQAKVLDFSLARKTFVNSEDITQVGMSMPGMIVGTVSYMSPEQARGKTLDVRTDIWSLGVVLYEMLTGKLPFKGETSSDTIAAILRNDLPPLEQTGREFPVELSQIVQKALAKSPDKRYQSAHEMMRDIGRITDVSDADAASYDADTIVDNISTRQQRYPFTGQEPLVDTAANTAQQEKSKSHGFPSFGFGKWVMAASLLLAVGIPGGFIWYKSSQKPTGFPTNLVRTEITSWKNDLGFHNPGRPRFSPDGKLIAFASTRGGKQAIWLKQLDGGEPFTRKEDGDDSIDTDPIFSPDGQQLAFISTRGEKTGIWTMPVLGGARILLKEIELTKAGLMSWSKDGQKIYFQSKSNAFTYNLNTKETEQITPFEYPNSRARDFSISSDEQRLLYSDLQGDQSDIWSYSIKDKSSTKITNDKEQDGLPLWFSDDSIIYNSIRNNIEQVYETNLTGSKSLPLTLGNMSSRITDVSLDKRQILYWASREDSDLWQLDLTTNKESVISAEIDAEIWASPSIEKDRLAFQVFPAYVRGQLYESSIRVKSLDSESNAQLIDRGFLPQWSPDGKNLAFLRLDNGVFNLWTIQPSGGSAQQITRAGINFGGYYVTPLNRMQTTDYVWSRDGQSIIYSAKRDDITNIWQSKIDSPAEINISGNTESGWFFFAPAITIDQKKIAWIGNRKAKQAGGQTIYALWLHENGKSRVLFESNEIMDLLGWSIDEKELLLKTIPADKKTSPITNIGLKRINISDGKISKINDLSESYFTNIQLSPDKKQIAFVSRQDGKDTLELIPTEGGISKTVLSISDPLVYLSALAWSHDGKSIYYSKHANWSIISMLETPK